MLHELPYHKTLNELPYLKTLHELPYFKTLHELPYHKNICWKGSAGVIWAIFWFALTFESPIYHPTISLDEKNYIVESIGRISRSSLNVCPSGIIFFPLNIHLDNLLFQVINFFPKKKKTANSYSSNFHPHRTAFEILIMLIVISNEIKKLSLAFNISLEGNTTIKTSLCNYCSKFCTKLDILPFTPKSTYLYERSA